MALVWAIGASVAVSLISFIGIVSLLLKEKWLDRTLMLLVGFSAGGLIGSAFLNLLPEALETWGDPHPVFLCTISGFLAFFLLERYFFWRHCHNEHCEVHAFTYLNLIGDGIHNFGDGLIIGTSFLAGMNIGLATTAAIILHEIPQEMGDFGVLVYGGMEKSRALFFNFLSAAMAIAGTVAGYYFAVHIGGFSRIILPAAAGGFIYIAACDLIPELRKELRGGKSAMSFAAFLLGIYLIYLIKPCSGH